MDWKPVVPVEDTTKFGGAELGKMSKEADAAPLSGDQAAAVGQACGRAACAKIRTTKKMRGRIIAAIVMLAIVVRAERVVVVVLVAVIQ